MGLIADLAQSNPGALPENPSIGGEVSKGVSRGLRSLGASGEQALGLGAEALGFDSAAKGLRSGAQSLREAAAAPEFAPEAQDWAHVNGAGQALRWGMGKAGEMVPMLAGVAAGTMVGGPVAGAATMFPDMVGNIDYEQQQNPNIAALPVGERALRNLPMAVAGTAASALPFGNVLKGGTAAKTLAGSVGRNVGEGVVTGAVGMGATDVATQMGVDPNASVNWHRAGEAAVDGGVAMGLLHTPGALAGYAKGHGADISAAAGKMKSTIAERVAAAKEAAGEKVDAIKADAIKADAPATKVSSPYDDLGDLIQKGRTKVDEFLGRMKNGEDGIGVDPAELATATKERVKQMFDLSDNESAQRATQWAKDMLDDTGLDAAKRAEISAAAQDIGNKASQKTIASLKAAWDMGKDAAGRIGELHDFVKGREKPAAKAAEPAAAEITSAAPSINARREYIAKAMDSGMTEQEARDAYVASLTPTPRAEFPEAPTPPDLGTKKSEDYSGANAAVHKALIDSGLAKSRPELFHSNESINKMASVLRQVGSEMVHGDLSSDLIAKAIDVFGKDTPRVLDTVTKALHGSGLNTAKAEMLFKNANKASELANSRLDLHDTIRSALTEDAQGSTLSGHIPKLADTLVAHARGELTKGKGPEETAAINRRVAELMKEHFGENADAVSKKVEKAASEKEGVTHIEEEVDANGHPMGEAATDRIVVGHGKNNAKMVDPDIFKAQNRQGLNHAQQALLDAKAKYPDRAVRFERGVDENGKQSIWGHVVAEKAADPTSFNEAELKGMAHDTKKFPNSPSRLKVGDMNIDAVKVAKVMREKGYSDFEGPANLTAKERLADAFKKGIAQLIEQSGQSVAVPDGAVIGFVGGKALTWGEAKKGNKAVGKEIDAQNAEAAAHEQHLAELRKQYKAEKDPDARAKIKAEAEKAIAEHEYPKDAELTADPDARKSDAVDEAKPQETDKDGQIHTVAKDLKGEDLVSRSNMDGSAKYVSDRADVSEAISNLANELKARTSKPQQALGAKLAELVGKVRLNAEDFARLSGVLADKKPSAVAAIVNELAEKYAKAKTTKKATAEATRAEPSLGALNARLNEINHRLENPEVVDTRQYLKQLDSQRMALEAELEARSTPNPKPVAAKKAALTEKALSGDKGLHEALAASDDAKGLQRAIGHLAETAPGSEALKVATARLRELVQDPDVALGMQTRKYSMDASKVDPKDQTTAQQRTEVKDHITKVLGNTVKVAWKNLTNMEHAGDYTHSLKLIRLSIHALDPMSTAYHESLHAFFGQLRDAGARGVTDVLEKAASSQHVMEQLMERYKGNDAVLKQLKDPEERAAYMYQTWASDPTFKLTPASKGVFAKISDFIHHLMGAWTNDQRAAHIMQYFNSGEYARDMTSPSAVRHALMERNRSQVLETAKSFMEPLGKLADSVVGMGGDRLRDSGIGALGTIADLVKREHTKQGGDQGFINAARVEATKMRTALGQRLEAFSADHLRDAMEALQSGGTATLPEGRLAAKEIKTFLREVHNYMTDSGLKVGDLGPDYFPRVWDTHYISKNQQAFRDMLEPYIRAGKFTGSADDLIRTLTNNGGAELSINDKELAQPGMQFSKQRFLEFINPRDAAQFVSKDMMGTLSTYINQAVRKSEWHTRFGDGKLAALLEQAREQGATKDHIAMTEKYMRGIDGTLGDTLDPNLRRLYGNMIVYQNVRLLPTAAFSMLIDPLGVIVRGGTVRDSWSTFKRGMVGIKDTFKKDGGASADQATRWAELVGVVDSAMMSHAMGDVFSQGMVGGTGQKINNAFFKYNFVEGLNRNFRIGASEAAIKFLGRHAGGLEGLGDSIHSERWMKELGLEKGDIKATKDGIALTQQDGLSAAQEQRVHNAINQWVDGAVLRPDAADKPMWMNDPHYALISHLKQFVFSFQKTILARVAHEAQHGNYTPMMALASYVPTMIAADMAKGLIVSGGQPTWQQGWGAEDYLEYGIERSGMYGVGQFGVDIAKDLHRGGTGIGALSGPTIEQLGDMVKTLGGHREFGNTVIDALPANTLIKGWSGKGEAKADPIAAE